MLNSFLGQPAFGQFSRFVDLVEGLDGVENRLHLAGLKLLIEDGVEIEVLDLAASGQYAGAFAVRRDQAAAVDLDLAVLPDEAKLYREPEETAHTLQRLGVGEACADFAVAFEEVCEDGVGVHGDVAEDVVEDVRLWGIFHRVARTEPGGRGKHAGSEHLEEGVGREEATDRGGLPAGSGLQKRADLGEIGQLVFLEADLAESVEILLAGVFAELRHTAADQLGPDGVLLGGVVGPCLFDQIRRCHVQLALGQIQR